MWVHPDIVESQQWTTVTNRKNKGKAGASHCNLMSVSSRETDEGVASSLTQKKSLLSLLT